MKQHWHVMAAAVIVVAATHGVGPGAAFAGQKPLQQRIDPSTGAHVRVFSGATARDLRVEIEDPSVLIRKEFTNLTSLTTIISGDERISFVVDRSGLTVTSGQERVEVRRGRQDLADDARVLVVESQAVRRATNLLARLADAPDPALRHTVRATRLMLVSAAGNTAGARELVKAAGPARAERIVRTSNDEQGPGACWYLYAAEAIAAYIEYEDCMNQLYWYELLDMIGCALIYDMRAIGAFSWWVTCVGFRS
jgi:hypothetical protein